MEDNKLIPDSIEPEVKPVSAITKGVLIALVLIVLSLVVWFMNIDVTKGGLQYLFTVIAVGGVIWSVLHYGKQIDHNGTYGKYFSHGFTVTVILTLLMIGFILVEVNLLPGFKEDMIQKSMEQATKSQQEGGATQEQIEMGLEFFKKYFTLLLIGGTLLSYMFFGTIGALLGAAFTKKNPKPIFE